MTDREMDAWLVILREAVLNEREACARIIESADEDFLKSLRGTGPEVTVWTALATEIRARKPPFPL